MEAPSSNQTAEACVEHALVLDGDLWCNNVMAVTRSKGHKRQRTSTRRSVAINKELDSRIKALARQQNRSANQIIENLIAAGLEAKEAEKRHFFEVAERMRSATDPAVVKEAKEELARMIFGN